mmetsp:Transcript_17519/g.57296  ORF Transcript_17519/g.57296 Transcript_17519/m.57296 type:complete len:203 (+) Transcript_17519:160-768(+)
MKAGLFSAIAACLRIASRGSSVMVFIPPDWRMRCCVSRVPPVPPTRPPRPSPSCGGIGFLLRTGSLRALSRSRFLEKLGSLSPGSACGWWMTGAMLATASEGLNARGARDCARSAPLTLNSGSKRTCAAPALRFPHPVKIWLSLGCHVAVTTGASMPSLRTNSSLERLKNTSAPSSAPERSSCETPVKMRLWSGLKPHCVCA